VKVPRTITHDQKLRRARVPLERFLAESAGLSDKRGPLLVQLPPSLAFEPRVAARFFELLRARHEGHVVCEPRHGTWISPAADSLLARYGVARVAADPPTAPGAQLPGGWSGLVYFRLHGSPRKYWSRYTEEYVDALSDTLRKVPGHVDAWCVFDNTASGAAIENACELHSHAVSPGDANAGAQAAASSGGPRPHEGAPQVPVTSANRDAPRD
jgi:uncharacterized protein YecE (DUF72 family)